MTAEVKVRLSQTASPHSLELFTKCLVCLPSPQL